MSAAGRGLTEEERRRQQQQAGGPDYAGFNDAQAPPPPGPPLPPVQSSPYGGQQPAGENTSPPGGQTGTQPIGTNPNFQAASAPPPIQGPPISAFNQAMAKAAPSPPPAPPGGEFMTIRNGSLPPVTQTFRQDATSPTGMRTSGMLNELGQIYMPSAGGGWTGPGMTTPGTIGQAQDQAQTPTAQGGPGSIGDIARSMSLMMPPQQRYDYQGLLNAATEQFNKAHAQRLGEGALAVEQSKVAAASDPKKLLIQGMVPAITKAMAEGNKQQVTDLLNSISSASQSTVAGQIFADAARPPAGMPAVPGGYGGFGADRANMVNMGEPAPAGAKPTQSVPQAPADKKPADVAAAKTGLAPIQNETDEYNALATKYGSGDIARAVMESGGEHPATAAGTPSAGVTAFKTPTATLMNMLWQREQQQPGFMALHGKDILDRANLGGRAAEIERYMSPSAMTTVSETLGNLFSPGYSDTQNMRAAMRHYYGYGKPAPLLFNIGQTTSPSRLLYPHLGAAPIPGSPGETKMKEAMMRFNAAGGR